MKIKFKYKIISALIIFTIAFSACTKKTAEIRLEPEVTTVDMGDITSSSATITGFIIASGDEGFIEKGICYNTTGDPTIENDTVVYSGDDMSATFTVTLTGLDYATTYYAKAYGINSNGVLYGSDTTFTTLPILPTVETEAVTNIDVTTAVSGGNVTLDGGSEVTVRGVCWSKFGTPTVDSLKTENGAGTGTFVSDITGLESETMYYVRAYATNEIGTAYGEEISFTTNEASFTPNRLYVISGGTTLGSIVPRSPDDFITEEGHFEGYIWFPAGNLSFILSDMETGGTILGDNEDDGVLEFDGTTISVAEEGFYKIIVNVISFEYSTAIANWGLIGSATPGGWNTSTDMTYLGNEIWEVTETLVDGMWKVRANNEWADGLVYGDYAPIDGILDDLPGGGDIPVTAGDWKITIDLSEFPYTYTIEAIIK